MIEFINRQKALDAISGLGGCDASDGYYKGWDNAISAVFDEIAKLPVNQWIPCSELLPKIMERVLVYAEYTGEKSKNPNINNDVMATNWIDNHGKWVCMGLYYEVKAWMHLPEPPGGEIE